MLQYKHMTEEVTAPKRKVNINAIIITVAVITLALVFGTLLLIRSGIFHQPGKIIFQDTTTEENRDFANTNLTDLELKDDVTIGAISLTAKADNPNFVLYNILLPVTDFYSTATDISSQDATNGTLVSIWDLNASQKLLSLNGNYFLNSFDKGAFFEYFTIEGKNPEDTQKVIDLLRRNIATFPAKDEVLTLAQTGVAALSRRMNTRLDTVKDAKYFSEKIADYLSSFDLTHTSNESSFSNLANGSNICSKPAMIDVLTDIGLDIVELTGNHNQDCGDVDAIATIDQYHNLGMQTFGGGITATDAAIPLEINAKGNNITLLGYNLSTGGYTLDNTPGANFYTEEKAQKDIAAAKERGDFIIVDIQYYECNEYVDTQENTICDAADSSAGDQVKFFRSLIDMGANVVVGTAAHQPQTYELYHGGEIYYGLGNLFFDQSAWPGTTRSLVLEHYFWQGNLLQTRITPTVYDESFQTELMDAAATASFLERLIKVCPAE